MQINYLFLSLAFNAFLLFCLLSPNIVYFLNKRWFMWRRDKVIPNTLEVEKEKSIPYHVSILAKTIPILEWKDGTNLSKGEIKKFNFVKGDQNKFGFNQQVLSFEDKHEWIWRHIADDYFKCIGKSKE